MSERANHNPYTLEDLLGDDFQRLERRSIGAVDSAHETAPGVYKGEEVVAKPFYKKTTEIAVEKASKEASLERLIAEKGMRTVKPLEVVRPLQPRTAVLVSKYIPGLMGANTLTLEADPDSSQGLVIARQVGSIALLLGEVHGEAITHGDPQVKNFAFLASDLAGGTVDDPLVYDFESGLHHTLGKARGKELFENAAKNDVGRLGLSLGRRLLGGSDDSLAEDVFREVVLRPYSEVSPASEIMTGQAVAAAIDKAQAEFMRGRASIAAHIESQKVA